MDEFVILKNSIEKEIADLRASLLNIENKHNKSRELQDIIDNIYNETIKLIDVDRKNKVKELFPELSDLVSKVDSLSDLETFLKLKKYNSIDNDGFKELLARSGLSYDAIEKLLSELEFCRELDELVSDPLYDDESMKKSVMQSNQLLINTIDTNYHALVKKLIDLLKEKYEEKYGSDKEDYEEIINELQLKIDNLEEMNSRFDEHGLVSFFENREKLQEFYQWMKDNVDLEIQLNIIIAVTKYGLARSLDLGKEEQEELDETIDRNREDIIGGLQETSKVESEITFDNLDLSKFENEQTIISRMKVLYEELSNKTKERLGFISEEESKVIDRVEYYFVDDKYNWDIILADIEDNLLPNIYQDRDLVFNAFKIIINVVDKRKTEESEIKIGIAKLNEYLGQLNPFMKYADKHETKYDYLIENNYDKNSELFGHQVSYEFIDLGYYCKHTLEPFVNELVDFKKTYENCLRNDSIILDSDKFNDGIISEKFIRILGECNSKFNAYQVAEQEKFKSPEEVTKSYDYSENLVFCIENIELESEGHRNELRETVKELEGKTHRQLENAGNTPREQLDTIDRKTETGEKIRYDDPRIKPYCKYFLPYRYAGQADYRTGLVHFTKVHPEIRKKLQERYNLGNQCGIYGIFMVIKAANSNHNEYADFEDYINDHMQEIDKLGMMFDDPNTDIDMLCRIIDDGITKKESLISNKEY